MAQQPVRKKMYRTMQGRLVDIDKLRATNETVKAVGNMNVNARGDVIGQGGRVIQTKDEVMKAYYQAPKGQAQDTPVEKVQPTETPTPKKQVVQSVVQPNVINTTQPKTEQVKTPQKTDLFKPKTPIAEKSGIDAALDGIE
jgi:hypothetical protein